MFDTSLPEIVALTPILACRVREFAGAKWEFVSKNKTPSRAIAASWWILFNEKWENLNLRILAN